MKTQGLTLLILLAILTPGKLFSQPADCSVREQIKASGNTVLSIANRFGNITILNSPTDSISICGTATVDHPDGVIASKSLNLIKMEVKRSGDSVLIITTFDDRFFSSSFKNGRKSFSVDYTINLPPYITIDIDNSFGNISIGKHDGKADIRIEHGNLTVAELTRGNIKPLNNLIIHHSRAEIGRANWLHAEAVHSQDFKLGEVKAITIASQFSTITLSTANSAVISSRSDVVSIGSISNLVAESWMSRIKIAEMAKYGQINAEISDFIIGNLQVGFNELRATTKNGSLSIGIPSNSLFRLRCTVDKDGALSLPESLRDNIKVSEITAGARLFEGVVGSGHTESYLEASVSKGRIEFIQHR